MALKKCKAFENISINSASNDKVRMRCSISSFIQVSIPGYALLFSQKLFFSIFHGKMHNNVKKFNVVHLAGCIWILP